MGGRFRRPRCQRGHSAASSAVISPDPRRGGQFDNVPCCCNGSAYRWRSSNRPPIDYTELIQIEAVGPDGKAYSAAGTLIGKGNNPRITRIDGRDGEVPPRQAAGAENADCPAWWHGGRSSARAASRSRHVASRARRGTAYMVVRVDSEPSRRRPAGDQIQPGHARWRSSWQL